MMQTGLGFPLNGVIWLTILDETYNRTGAVLTQQESEQYFPIVPLLVYEQHIPQPLFTVQVERDMRPDLGPNVQKDFNYTDGGVMTLGGYPEGMRWGAFPLFC